MSTYRIKGDDGVIVDSAKYLELPKGPDSARPTNPRAGMMRYNDQATSRGIEASVIVESAGKQSLEWRRVAHLDKDGKLLTSQLPSTITGSLTYKGTWDADYNDVHETADDTSLDDRLPSAAGRVGHYYIVRTNGDGGVARGQAPTDLAPVTSNPKYRKGDWIVSNGATWEKVDQSQITTTAAQVQLVTTSMRPNKHAMGTSVSLQDAMDGLVEHALDRFEDTILGTITVSNDSTTYPNARILLADGSAAKPNLAFGTSPTTGLYWAAANTIGFSANNGMRLTLSPSILTSAVTVRNINGDAGTPSYSFTNSVKAGMYRVADNIVGITTDGTERARFYADGIRTLTLLANKGSADKVAYGFTEANDKNTADIGTGIFSPTTGQVTVATGSAQTATFSSSQVSTIVPVRVSNGETKLPSFSFTGDNKTGMWLNGTSKLSFSANETEVLTLTKTIVAANVQSQFYKGASASAPGISFKDEANSGLQWVSRNKIDFVVGGTAVMSYGLNDVTFSGETYIKDGTVAKPGLAFATDHTTGLFKADTTSLGLAAGGKLGLTIDEAQLVSVAKRIDVPTTTAAAPNITFAGQTNCGLFGTTGKVGVSVGGIEQIGISAAATTVATKLVVPAGTAAAPKFTLGSDNTGLYAPVGGSKLGIAAGGTPNMEFDATTNFSKLQLRVPVGTLALPSIVFDGDENTGLYRKGATTDPDNITFVANGAEIFQVTPTYTNPLTPVKLLDGSTTAPSLCFDTKQNTGLFYANGGVSVTSENDTVLAMTKSGITASKTVGLGTNSLTFGTDASIKTAATSNSTMAFKSGNTATTFTFGRDTAIYTTIFKDGLIVPVGTTANRPATPAVGTIRYNSDTKNLEAYVNTDWADLAGSGKIVSTGTEGAPAITLGTSTTTGIFSDATDTISFAAKGVKQLTISDAGAVFTNPIQINTGTGNVKIGSNNSSWIHFIGDKAFHFNKQVQAEGGFKVFNKDTALQSDGKIKEDGILLENKYAQFTPSITTNVQYAPGTKNIEVEKNSSIYWYNATDFAKITFEHNGVNTGTDQHMLFETGDDDNEYFKFAHRLSGSTANTEWMSIKKAGINVSGKTSTIGDWTVSASGLQFKGSNVINIASDGSVTVNGSASGSSGVQTSGDTMTGQLTFTFAPATSGATAHVFHNGNGTRGTAINLRSMRESDTSPRLWEKVASGSLYYSTGNSGASQNKIRIDVSGGEIYVGATGTSRVYHPGNKPTLAELGAAPSGFGLGTYASTVTDVNTDLRTTCGFFNGWNMTNRPAWPMAANGWDYIFNAAFGNTAGYNGMIAMDFEGQGLAFKTIFGGVDEGWKYVYHTGYKPTAADVGALALTGGSCSGAVSATSFSTAGGVTCTSVSVGSGRVNCGSVLATGTIEALKFTAGTGGITSTGDITSSGNITAYSDRSLKKDIIDLDSSLETVMKLRPVKYVMKTDKLEKVQVGFIAQEVQEVIPEVVVEHDDGLLSMDYSRITAHLVKAMQEQQRLIEELRSEIELLKNK